MGGISLADESFAGISSAHDQTDERPRARTQNEVEGFLLTGSITHRITRRITRRISWGDCAPRAFLDREQGQLKPALHPASIY
ncbi:hypothetical protein Pla52o_14870 [Novipirellula galeiformis]|uniref:Uncharacterized protein n=1 Tax=Novipirellula galeiformis TaxID=2528004 RepID=A0A5C6CQS5_9BACT|nr:hypothetical protein Pla52o_14870 [Novipirellula galeiformis]